MRRMILLMTVAALVVASALGGVVVSRRRGTPTSDEEGLDQELQLQAGQGHHRAGHEGHLDQQGHLSAHRHGEQRKIV